MLMHYVDSDLGQYHEYGTNVMVNPPGSNASGPRALQSAGAFIHHLPVDQAFTLEAGTDDLGLPESDGGLHRSRRTSVRVRRQHRRSIRGGHGFRQGCRFRLTPRTQAHPTYSHRDGVTRETSFEHTLDGVRNRSGGVRIWLGDHPDAKELGVAWPSEARDIEQLC